jgi:hypothetical protein
MSRTITDDVLLLLTHECIWWRCLSCITNGQDCWRLLCYERLFGCFQGTGKRLTTTILRPLFSDLRVEGLIDSLEASPKLTVVGPIWRTHFIGRNGLSRTWIQLV